MQSQSEIVLKTLAAAHLLDRVQEVVELVCQTVAEMGPYRRCLLSLIFEDDVYVGLHGGTEEMRLSFLESATETAPGARAQKRKKVLSRHRIGDTQACFIPAESDIVRSSAYVRSELRPDAEWKPDDRLMVFVRGVSGEIAGVMSLDEPSDGKRPVPHHLEFLKFLDHFVSLMGVVIHNKYLAKQLQESQSQYAAVVEQGHDGLFIVRDDRILFANRVVGEMLGVEPHSLIDRSIDDVLKRGQGGHLPGEWEHRLVGAGGESLLVTIKSGPIQYGGERATLVAVADVTESARIRSQLLRAQKMEMVGTLSSGIAHDFNNLLGGIVGYTSLLKTKLKEGDQRRSMVEGIERAADRAAAVTRQLLGLVRQEKVQITRLRVGDLFEDVGRLLRETLDPAIRVEIDASADLPYVLGDEAQLHQLLLNVALNARDAMTAGGTLSFEASPAGTLPATRVVGRFVRLSVVDTGFGMDAETVAKVFDPFFTTKTAGKGTGLGLYMVYRIAERHGGTVDITSEPGKGTRIDVFLPAAEMPSRPHREAEPEPQHRGGQGTVLLVDDEELIRHVTTEMLQSLGYDVVTAPHGEEAVARVAEDGADYACVILDVAMPTMDGWDAACRIHELSPDLPVILSSGQEMLPPRASVNSVSHFFLKKPYRISDLDEALRNAIDSRPSRDVEDVLA